MKNKKTTTHIESLILRIRGQRVIVDADLANLYGVSTKQLNQQIKRNLNRFPLINIFIILTVFSLSTFASAETYMPNGPASRFWV